MSVARGFINAGHYYSNIAKPVKIDLTFVVDSTNANGLGISSLKSNGYVRNVFMNTSATPGSGDGLTNPNPAAGYAWVQMKQNFNAYLGNFRGVVSPLTGSNLTSTTTGLAYVITAVGTTTAAQWLAAGVPAGLTPAVNMSFIAKASGALGGNGTVKVPTVSGISAMEVVGDPNVSINNSSIAANGGAWVLVQFLGATAAGNTALIPTAPVNTSVVSMSFFFDGSSVTVDGL